MRLRFLAPVIPLSIVCALAACGDNETHPTHAAYDAGAPQPLACVPNLDGKIEANELIATFGVPISYLFSPNGVTRMVDVAGKQDSAGHLTWDFSVDYADDQVAHFQALPITGKWYATSFPANAFVVPFDGGDTVEGVYLYDTSGYHLLGLASTQMTPPEGQTLYIYDAPVDIFRFPIAPGDAYTSVGNVKNAMLRGLPYAGQDKYDVAVDGAGTLVLPSITFTQALRVRTSLTVMPSAGATATTKQVSFLFECFGEVARATSQKGETQDNFTTASEVRRIGLLP